MCHFVLAIKKAPTALRTAVASEGGAPETFWADGNPPYLAWCVGYVSVHLSFVRTHGPVHVRSVYLTVGKRYCDF